MGTPAWLTALLAVIGVIGPLVGVWLGYRFSTKTQREQREEEQRIRRIEQQRSAVADFLREVQEAENDFHSRASKETRWAREKNTEFILAGKPELCGTHGDNHKSALENLCLQWINRAQTAWAVMDLQLTDPDIKQASAALSTLGSAILSEFRRTYKFDGPEPSDFNNGDHIVYYNKLRVLREVASQKLN